MSIPLVNTMAIGNDGKKMAEDTKKYAVRNKASLLSHDFSSWAMGDPFNKLPIYPTKQHNSTTTQRTQYAQCTLDSAMDEPFHTTIHQIITPSDQDLVLKHPGSCTYGRPFYQTYIFIVYKLYACVLMDDHFVMGDQLKLNFSRCFFFRPALHAQSPDWGRWPTNLFTSGSSFIVV